MSHIQKKTGIQLTVFLEGSVPERCFPGFLRLELCPEGSLLNPKDKAPEVAHHQIVVLRRN
jgi:hypothetical protein